MTQTPRQCHLRLSPDVPCDTAAARALLALSIITFAAFSVALPAACGWLLWTAHDLPGAARPRAAGLLDAFFLHVRPDMAWRWLWVVCVAYGRKFFFAVLVRGGLRVWYSCPVARSQVGSSSYGADTSLPLWVFAGLLLLLVCVLIGQPYRLARDNRLDVVCIVVLLFSYFASGAR